MAAESPQKSNTEQTVVESPSPDCNALVQQEPTGKFGRWLQQQRSQRFDRALRKKILSATGPWKGSYAPLQDYFPAWIQYLNERESLRAKEIALLQKVLKYSGNPHFRSLAQETLSDPPSMEKIEKARLKKQRKKAEEKAAARKETAEREKDQRQLNLPSIGYWGYSAPLFREFALREAARRGIYGLSGEEREALRRVSALDSSPALRAIAAEVLKAPFEAWYRHWFLHVHSLDRYTMHFGDDSSDFALEQRASYLNFVEEHVGRLDPVDVQALQYALMETAVDHRLSSATVRLIHAHLKEDARLKEEAGLIAGQADPLRSKE